MTRMIYVTIISLPIVLFYLLKSFYVLRHMDRYSELQRYRMVQHMIYVVKKNGRIHTKVFGKENLPEDGGYVMYPNHQGKYDALGIIYAHNTPCTFLIDDARADLPLTKEITRLLEASRLDKTSLKNQAETIFNIVRQVADGKRFIVFPEGGYTDNQNSLQDFLPGAFKCSIRSKTPIVPVALVDSYKVFGINSLRRVSTQVHFLPPIHYEEYRDMTSRQIAQLVRSRIETAIAQNT